MPDVCGHTTRHGGAYLWICTRPPHQDGETLPEGTAGSLLRTGLNPGTRHRYVTVPHLNPAATATTGTTITP